MSEEIQYYCNSCRKVLVDVIFCSPDVFANLGDHDVICPVCHGANVTEDFPWKRGGLEEWKFF